MEKTLDEKRVEQALHYARAIKQRCEEQNEDCWQSLKAIENWVDEIIPALQAFGK